MEMIVTVIFFSFSFFLFSFLFSFIFVFSIFFVGFFTFPFLSHFPPPTTLISGSYCVFCPENGDLPCQKVDAYDNEEDCGNGVACELRNGTVIFTSTEEECRFIFLFSMMRIFFHFFFSFSFLSLFSLSLSLSFSFLKKLWRRMHSRLCRNHLRIHL